MASPAQKDIFGEQLFPFLKEYFQVGLLGLTQLFDKAFTLIQCRCNILKYTEAVEDDKREMLKEF